MFAWEALGTFYVLKVAKVQAAAAASVKGFIQLVRGLVVYSYIEDPYNLVPIVLASFIASYITIKVEQNLDGE